MSGAAAPLGGVGPGQGIFAHVKQAATERALRYAGARMSTVGRRVVVSGHRQLLGHPADVADPARDALRSERRVTYASMAQVRQELAALAGQAPHWSEVDA